METIQPDEYMEQIRSNFNILAQNMMTILENEYNLGRLTGDQYAMSFNEISKQMIETSRQALSDYFNSILKKEEYDIASNIKSYKIDQANLQNKKLEKEIEEIDVRKQLEEIKTKVNVRNINNEIDVRVAHLKLEVDKMELQNDKINNELNLNKTKIKNGYLLEKSKIISNMITTQLQAWSTAISSGELDNESGISNIPDFVTNKEINDSVSNISKLLSKLEDPEFTFTTKKYEITFDESACTLTEEE